MGTHLTVTGEQFFVEATFRTDLITRPSSVDIMVYNDSTDTLADTDNLSDVTTEPAGGNYQRQSVNLDQSTVTLSENGSNNWQAVFDQVSFDTSDSTQTVDAYAVVATFDATNSTGGNSGDNLIVAGSLGTSYDLSNVDTLNVSNTGVEQT